MQLWFILFLLLASSAWGGALDLTQLKINPSGLSLQSTSTWASARMTMRSNWLAFLGPLPEPRPPLKTEVLASEELASFTRQYIRYTSELGIFTDGYLLRPRLVTSKLPAIVVFHPTTPSQAKAMAGLDADYPEEKRMGLHFVEQGYVVWCPRNYINREGADWAGNAAKVRAAHTNWTGMTQMLWDAIRAADFLESLPEVDSKRIGCIGHSLGAKAVLYAMAFDERYRVGVSSEGGVGMSFSNWEAPWYLGPNIKSPTFKLDHRQLLALAAPRAFLLLAGESADGERSQAYIDAGMPIYRLLGAPENLRMLNHRQGHRYPPEARAAAEAFFRKNLPFN
jgi:dienelactone hydrolase